ncbi:hypothetical protein Tsubulata_010999 [Turnera subulata]|uniref:DUF4283 domain-containing protein n=1 Tax=Turnera subulata TaxID=218843 RepID=A0A9Q0JI96_9ROSI|nr:hypothetical protein Tsubulata_010999 [Turnera subulata]
MAIDSCSTVFDSNGALCAKPAMALNLDHLDLLLKTRAPVRNQSKGKNAASIVTPSSSMAPPTSSTKLGPIAPPAASPCNLGPRVSSAVDLIPTVSVPVSIVDQQSRHVSPTLVAPPPGISRPSWASVATGNSTVFHQPLQFVPPVFAADSNVLTIPSNLIELGRKKFSTCLGPVSVSHYNSGLFLLNFPTDIALQRATHGGPWHIGGIPLLLRQWCPNIKPVDLNTPIIPVWVQLNHVPPELLTTEGLSYLASVIGKPLHLNQDCSHLFSERVNVCIEVDFSKPVLHAITIAIDGCTRTVDVTYSWQPQLCEICHTWGHHHLTCHAKRPTTVWIPKSAHVDPTYAASPPNHHDSEVFPSSLPAVIARQSTEATVAVPVAPLVAASTIPHVDNFDPVPLIVEDTATIEAAPNPIFLSFFSGGRRQQDLRRRRLMRKGEEKID